MQYIYIYNSNTQLILDSQQNLHYQIISKWFTPLDLGHAPLNFSYPPIVHCITLLQVNIARAFAFQKKTLTRLARITQRRPTSHLPTFTRSIQHCECAMWMCLTFLSSFSPARVSSSEAISFSFKNLCLPNLM